MRPNNRIFRWSDRDYFRSLRNMLFMKYLLIVLLLAFTTIGYSQKKFLRDDTSIAIPAIHFDTNGELAIVPSPTSSVADFDFLVGKWKLKHERLTSRLTQSNEWEEFETAVEDFRILEGMGHMDVGHAVQNGKAWEGRTIRLFNPKTRLWSLYWVESNAVILDPPVVGSFENGVGHFFTKHVYNGKKVIMLFRWDARNKEKPIWSQAFSPDNGKTWEWNWYNLSERIQ